jgi:hypothetical protein
MLGTFFLLYLIAAVAERHEDAVRAAFVAGGKDRHRGQHGNSEGERLMPHIASSSIPAVSVMRNEPPAVAVDRTWPSSRPIRKHAREQRHAHPHSSLPNSPSL